MLYCSATILDKIFGTNLAQKNKYSFQFGLPLIVPLPAPLHPIYNAVRFINLLGELVREMCASPGPRVGIFRAQETQHGTLTGKI